MPNNISQKDNHTSEKHCQISQRHWKSTVLTIAIIMGLLILHSSGNQAIAKTNISLKSNLTQQEQKNNNQQGATASTEPQAAPQILEKDKPIERELKGGEVHSYTITMEANQYLNAVVEQTGINVIVTIFAPDGKKIYQMDSSPNIDGPELIALITESKGSYRVEIATVEKDAQPGKYQIKINELRVSTDQDKQRVDGYKTFSEAVQLQIEGSRESIDQAITKYEAATAIFDKTAGESIAEAQVLNSVAILYFSNKGEYDKAADLFQRSLTIREKVLGPEHHDVAISLNNLAECYRLKADYSKAEPLYQRALDIDEKVLGPNHIDVAEVLNNLALIYQERGEYDKTEVFYQRSLAVLEKTLNPNHLYIALSLNNLADVYRLEGNYIKAEPLYLRSLTILEKTLGPEHFYVANILSNLGILYREIDDYSKAEFYYKRALATIEKTLGPDHANASPILNNLALLYLVIGEYNKAETLLQRSLAIREKSVGHDHPEVATVLNNLALVYLNKGEIDKAASLNQQALTIYEKKFGPEHPKVATSLNNLAGVYCDKGEYNKAISLYQRAIAIREKVLGPENVELAISLSNLGFLYNDKGENDKAESLLQRSLAIREKAFGLEHTDVAVSLNNLAFTARSKGDYVKAGSLHQRALTILEKALSPTHPEVAKYVNSLAGLYRIKGDINEAIKYKERSDEIREEILAKNLISGSQKEKLAYLNLTSFELDQTLTLHLQNAINNKQAARLALTSILRRKGRALDAMTNSIAILRRRANAEDQVLLDQLASVRTQYAKLSLKGKDKAEISEYNVQLKALADQIESLEKEVSNRSAEFKIQSQPITLIAVQQAIPDNAVLIEFAAYTQYDNNDKPGARHYAVYLLTNKSEPLFTELGDADLIDQAITKLRDVLPNRKSSITKEVKPAARALDQLIMQPVRKLLGDKKRLLISPDGALNLVPFDALVDEHNKYLVEQFEISYLTSGRDLLRLQNGIKSDNAPLVMADPDFAQGPGPKFGEESFEPLKRLEATADEANQIKTELASEKPTVLLQAQATKNALIAVHRPTILHIATHGFFLGNESANLTETQRIAIRHKIEEGNSAGISLQNPLLRSGLFFANANAQGEDATLTALEATGLDLWGTKLVVLSACNTGVGEVKSGDGVYGLRRALVLAGSESQMMSLWPVSDKGTKDLMVAYYEALKHDEGRSAGLRKVRLSFLKKPDRTHPYYWASFIQSGEWANLKGQR